MKNFLFYFLKSFYVPFKDRLGYVIQHPHAIMPSAVLAFDTLMAFLSLFIALYLRVGDEFLDYSPQFILKNMLVFALVCTSLFYWMQTHRTLWRYIAFEDIIPLSLAAILSTTLYFPLMILIGQQESMPRSVAVITSLVLVILLAGPRFLYRLIYERHLYQQRRHNAETSVPVLLIGDSDQAEIFIRESLHSPHLPYHPMALVTLNKEETGRKIHGVPIAGHLKELMTILNDYQHDKIPPKQLIITHKQLDSESRRYISQAASIYGLTLMHLLHHFSVDILEE